MTLTDDEKACCLALVYRHVKDSRDYTSWVPSYHTVRRPLANYYSAAKLNRCSAYAIRIGGHFRRKALYRRLLCSLKQTCKFEDLSFKDVGWPSQ